MSRKRKAITATSALLVLLLGALLIVPDHSNCRSPLISTSRQKADTIVAGLVEQLGGLPKSAMDLSRENPNAVIHPIVDWDVEAVTVGNTKTLLGSMSDDDPTYDYTIDLWVSYADGGQKRLRWFAWRYGLVICPALVVPGDGPPGRITLLN